MLLVCQIARCSQAPGESKFTHAGSCCPCALNLMQGVQRRRKVAHQTSSWLPEMAASGGCPGAGLRQPLPGPLPSRSPPASRIVGTGSPGSQPLAPGDGQVVCAAVTLLQADFLSPGVGNPRSRAGPWNVTSDFQGSITLIGEVEHRLSLGVTFTLGCTQNARASFRARSSKNPSDYSANETSVCKTTGRQLAKHPAKMEGTKLSAALSEERVSQRAWMKEIGQKIVHIMAANHKHVNMQDSHLKENFKPR